MRPSVLIVINSLHSGGTEKTCIELARYLNGRCDLEVVSLVIGGPAEQELRDLGVKVTVLQADNMRRMLWSFAKLARVMRRHNPQTVITFLYIADLFGGVLARLLLRRARVFWNIRNNVLARSRTGFSTFAISRLNGFVSRFVPDTVVYCSHLAKAQHESIGYRSSDDPVVENSIRAVPFTFSADKRSAARVGNADGEFQFLFVGRFDPVKCVDVYIDACARLYRALGGNLRFQIAGRGMDAGNPWLVQALEKSGVGERFALLGFVSDQQQMYSAADCLVVTSESEGSPNAVYEAMATQLPVIILGTLGTENLSDPLVCRLNGRDMDQLVEAMKAHAVGGASMPASRRTIEGADSSFAEHPLVTFYRRTLRCE